MPSSKKPGGTKRVVRPKYRDGTMGLQPFQTHIVLLAAIYQVSNGEADFERIATELNITVSSARRSFNGAKATIRKFLETKDRDDSDEDESKPTGKSTSPAPRKNKSCRDYDSDEDNSDGQDMAF